MKIINLSSYISFLSAISRLKQPMMILHQNCSLGALSHYSTPISAAKFPNCVRIDFAETLQRGSLDQNNQTYQHSFSEFVLLPVLWATSGLGLFPKYLRTQ